MRRVWRWSGGMRMLWVLLGGRRCSGGIMCVMDASSSSLGSFFSFYLGVSI